MMKGNYGQYKVVTSHNLYEYCDLPEGEEDKFREELLEEQKTILKNEIKTENVILHFIEDTAFLDEAYEYLSTTEIDEYIQYLAVKDGVNLVRFPNGNLGFVAYYNGHENGFEIIQTEMSAEEFEEVGQDMDWADYMQD